MDTPVCAIQQKYIHQLYTDSGRRPEDIPTAMIDSDVLIMITIAMLSIFHYSSIQLVWDQIS